MHRLTLAERVEHFKLTFPRNQAAWPWLTKENGHDVLYAVWVGGQDYRNHTRYHGAYPHNFLKKLLAFFPDVAPEQTLHAFAGSVPRGAHVRIDLNPATEPDLLGNVYDVAQLVGDRRFRLACADPPYTAADGQKYGTKGVDRARATAALAQVVVPRGFLAWLDTYAPIYNGKTWRLVGRIFVDRSTGHRVRRLAIFERLGPASRFASSHEGRKPEAPFSPEAIAARDCRSGHHGPLVDGDPVDTGACVNVDRICTDCALVVGFVSWTKAAWLKKHPEASC